jgi:RimJ/RimL family protein N-acetyltransferase
MATTEESAVTAPVTVVARDELLQQELHTERLILQPLALEDADSMYKLLQEREIAYNTMVIPFPYEQGMAESFIASTILESSFTNDAGTAATNTALNLAIRLKSDNTFMGAMRFDKIVAENDKNDSNNNSAIIRTGTMGYWLGKPYWGHGYCTEAAHELIRYGFLGALNLDRVEARHYSRNAASGNVMRKIGLKHIQQLPKHIDKWGVMEDVEMYAISKKDFLESV